MARAQEEVGFLGSAADPHEIARTHLVAGREDDGSVAVWEKQAPPPAFGRAALSRPAQADVIRLVLHG
ncbi:MAG: hypothetical protein AMXMBFR64_30140 [Myxococcales bacterium]